MLVELTRSRLICTHKFVFPIKEADIDAQAIKLYLFLFIEQSLCLTLWVTLKKFSTYPQRGNCVRGATQEVTGNQVRATHCFNQFRCYFKSNFKKMKNNRCKYSYFYSHTNCLEKLRISYPNTYLTPDTKLFPL